MVGEFRLRSTGDFWSFHIDLKKNPTIFFSNKKINTNVIYTVEELSSILERSDTENSFIPVPRKVMQNSLDEYYTIRKLAA